MKRLLLLFVLLAAGVAHAQTPISALPAATTSTTGVEPFPVVQAGTTKKMTLAQVVAYLVSQNNSWTGLNTFNSIIVNGTISFPNGELNVAPNQGAQFGPGTIGSTGEECIALKNNTPTFTDYCITDPANTTILVNKPSGAIAAILNAGIPICFGGANADLCVSDTAITIPTPTVQTPWPKFAYGSINGTSGCVLDTQVATAGISGCALLGTGNYLVSFSTSAGFTMPPACTIAVGSGSSGGSNAASVQSVTTAFGGSAYVATILAFTPGAVAQNNHFMITCMGQ